jgi:hypothetical protein
MSKSLYFGGWRPMAFSGPLPWGWGLTVFSWFGQSPRAIRQITRNTSAASFGGIDLQTAADHLRAVLHDVKTEAVL